MIVVGVAKRLTIQVGNEKGKERRKSLLHRREVVVARPAVPRFDRGKFRQRDQYLTNSLYDLLLFCRGELSQADRLVLHFDLAHAAQVEFIVCLDRDRGQ